MPVEIGQGVLNLTASFDGLQRDLERQIRGVDTRRAGSSAGDDYSDGFGGSIKKLTGVLAGAFAGVKVGGFVKDAIAQASDLGETTTKLQAIFGDSTAAIDDFGKTGAKALGQSNLAAKNAAAGFGVFGKAAGLASGDNAKFSTNLAQLATDMASFSNTSVDQATEALSAGLRGETEPLRAYGVLLDDASLRQEALAQGLITTTKDALTPQQKVLAANALIFKQTADAQGDFARTSGGLANQQRILSAQFEDLKGKVGQAFLPAVTGAVTALNEKLFPALESLGTKATAAWSILAHGDLQGSSSIGEEDSPLVSALFKAHDASLQVVPFLQEAWSILAHGDFQGFGAVEEDSPLVALMFKVREFGLDTFERLSGVWDTLKSTAIQLWEPIKQIASSLFDAFQTVSGSGLTAWDLLLDAFQGIADLLQATLVPAFTWLADFMRDNPEVVLTLVGAFVAWKTVMFAITAGTKLWAAAQVILNAVLDANPITLIITALAALAAGLVWAYNNVDWFREAVDTAWAWIKQAFDAAVQWIGPVMDQIGGFFVGLWNTAQPVFDFFKRSFDNFLTVIGGVIDVIAGVFTGDWSRVWEGIKGIFGGIWDQVQNIVSTAWEFIQSIGSKILDWFGALGGWVWDKITAFAGDMLAHGVEFIGWLGQGIIDGAVAIWGWFTSLPGWIWDKVAAGFGFIVDRGSEFIGWLWTGIKNGAVALFGWFTDLPSMIWDAIKDIGGKLLEFGGKIIGWIIDGIKAAASAVADAVTGLFDLTLNEEGTGFVTANPLAPGAGGGIATGVRGLRATAAGGGYVIPGYAPGVDNVNAILSPGEAVMVPEFVKAVGPENIYRWNRMARGGRAVSSDRILGKEMFAEGGIYGLGKYIGTHIADSVKTSKTGGVFGNLVKAIQSGILNAPSTAGYPAGTRGAFMAAVASQMGTQYLWGGANPPLFDCSGLMSWALDQAGAGVGRLTAAEFGDRFPRVSAQPGDMALFDTGRVSPKAGHIGMVLDTAAGTMMHTDGAGPARTSDYTHRGGLMGFIDPIGGEYVPPKATGGGLGGFFSTLAGKLRSKLVGSNAVGPSGDPGMNYNTSAGVEQWRAVALQALGLTGQPADYVSYVLHQMDTESSGNPMAINNWDSNAARGTPSKGLMQVIDPTFRTYAMPGYNSNIYDPLSNILAAIRYGIATYGSVPGAFRGVAYANGGIVPGNPAWGDSVPALLTPGEGVLPAPQVQALMAHARDLEAGFSGRQPTFNVDMHIAETTPERAISEMMYRAKLSVG